MGIARFDWDSGLCPVAPRGTCALEGFVGRTGEVVFDQIHGLVGRVRLRVQMSAHPFAEWDHRRKSLASDE